MLPLFIIGSLCLYTCARVTRTLNSKRAMDGAKMSETVTGGSRNSCHNCLITSNDSHINKIYGQSPCYLVEVRERGRENGDAKGHRRRRSLLARPCHSKRCQRQ